MVNKLKTVTWYNYVNTKFTLDREYFNSKIQALEKQVESLTNMFDIRLRESEANRKDSLNIAAKTIQDGLDKAERGVQDQARAQAISQGDALREAEKRVNEKFEAKDKAAEKTETALSERLLEMNKFRE